MNRFLRLAAIAAALTTVPTLTAVAPTRAETSDPEVSIEVVGDLPTKLAVGETATIQVHVESSEPFVMAIALSDAYYPGRGVFFDGSAAATRTTSADLYLTITGKESTADLGPVVDWPGEEDWVGGAAPVAVRVGVRFAGGGLESETFLFAVAVS